MKRTLVQALLAFIACVGLLAGAVAVCVHFGWFESPAPLGGGVGFQEDFDPAEFEPIDVLGKPMAVIDEIPVKRAAEIAQEVRDDELVLGVEVGGEFRAYPINQMTGPQREVFNDTLGGTAIAATW